MVLTKIPGELIADNTIATADLADGAVTTAKIAANTVTSAKLTSGAAESGATGIKGDIALLAFKTQANGNLAKYNLVDQAVDSFEDATGVDASASTDETRDSSGKYYSGSQAGNYFGNGELGDVTFGASGITQTNNTVDIDTKLSTGSEVGGPGNSSYGGTLQENGNVREDRFPFPSACYELTVPNKSGSYDGDMVVAQFKSLTIDANVNLTVDQPNRGLFIYCTGDCVINGALSMIARGGKSDPTTSGGSDANAVGAAGLQLGLLTSGGSQTLTNDGTGFNGAGTGVRTAIANQDNISGNGTIFTISKLGAAGGGGVSSHNSANAGASGATGATTISTGGGSSGYSFYYTGGGLAGGQGSCFSGGAGGGGGIQSSSNGGNVPSGYGTAGGDGIYASGGSGQAASGGVGNPGGSWTGTSGYGATDGQNGIGGIVWLVVDGNVTVGSGGYITVRGTDALDTGNFVGEGGISGGGAQFVLYSGSLTNNGSINADGGNRAEPSGGDGGKHNAQISQASAYNNMTLVSNSTTAQAAPTKADIVLTYTNGAGTATINTDLIASVSRDNGTTYTAVTLASQGTSGGQTILTASNVDISGQPSGTSMVWKVATANQSASKQTRIHGVSLGWA